MRQIFQLIIATLFILVGGSTSLARPAGDNEALDLLIQAYRNGGFNPFLLKSGTAEFERDRTVKIDSKLLEPVHRAFEESLRKEYGNDEKKLAEMRSRFAAQKDKGSNQQSKIRILFQGNDRYFGGNSGEDYKRLYDLSLRIPGTDLWNRRIFIGYGAMSARRPDGSLGSQLRIEWMFDQQLLWLRPQICSEGEFQFFGRFQEDPFSSVALLFRRKIDRKTFTFFPGSEEYFVSEISSAGLSLSVVGEVSYDSGAKAKVIEVKKGDTLLEKYHIDANRGYLCIYQFVATEMGDYTGERTASDFVQEKNTGFFFPQKYKERLETENVDLTVSEYTLVPDTLRLNQAVSDKEFAIDIPEGARVVDFREGEVDYISTESGTISLAKGGHDLPKLSWLVRKEDVKDYIPPTGGASGTIRWLLMGSGVVLVLAAIYLKWKKRFVRG